MRMLKVFENHLKVNNFSEKTITTYKHDLSLFFKFVNGKDETEVTKIDVENWKLSMIEKNAIPSVNRRMSTLKKYFTFLRDMDLIESNPTENVVRTRQKDSQKAEQEYIPLKEAVKIIEMADSSRDKAFIATALTTGLRFTELANLTLQNYREKHCEIIIKGGKKRIVTFNETACKYIDKYLAERYNWKCDRLFITRDGTPIHNRSMNIILKRIGKKAGYDTLHTHMFRHTCISYICQEHGIVAAQKFVNHSNISTTQKYAHVDNETLIDIGNSITF